MIRFDRVCPIIRIFSEEKALEFYVDFLGMNVDWEHRYEPGMPVYIQVSRTGLTLHLSEHHGDATPGSTVYVEMEGLDAFHSEISATGYKNLRPGIEDVPWNARMMSVTDPFGNRLRFCEPNEKRQTVSSNRGDSDLSDR